MLMSLWCDFSARRVTTREFLKEAKIHPLFSRLTEANGTMDGVKLKASFCTHTVLVLPSNNRARPQIASDKTPHAGHIISHLAMNECYFYSQEH